MKYFPKTLVINSFLVAISICFSLYSNAQCYTASSNTRTPASSGPYTVTTDPDIYEHASGNYFLVHYNSSVWFQKTNASKTAAGWFSFVTSSSSTPPLTGWNNGTILSLGCPTDTATLSTTINPVCYTLSTELIAEGLLDGGSHWHWYQDSLNTTSIGTGTSLSVTPPNRNTTYYCRAEDGATSFIGDSSFITVTVKSTLGNPVISGCGGSGSSITLSTDSTAGASYIWSEDGHPGYQTVGSRGFSAKQAWYTSLAFDSEDTLYVAYADHSVSTKASVMKFDGTSWVDVGSTGFTSGQAREVNLAISSEDTLYVSYRDEGTNKANVMKYNGTNWVVVGSAGFSAGFVGTPSLTIDSKDTLYVGYGDADGLGNYRATVKKYNGTSWVDVGSNRFTTNSAYNTLLAIDDNDTLYLAYSDGVSNKITVMKYNGTSWVLVGSAGFSTGYAFEFSLAIDTSGTPYVAFQDTTNASKKTTVMKYNGVSWANVGSPQFSAGEAYYISLAIDISGKPYIAYRDLGNNLRATIMKFNGSSWENLGNAGLSGSSVSYTSLALNSKGVPHIAYQDLGLVDDNCTVMKFIESHEGKQFTATDTSALYYLRATYANGCVVEADSVIANRVFPVALPTANGTTYQSDTMYSEGSWLHFCDCSQGYRLLSLDTTGTNAVVPKNGVKLKLGASKTESWSTAGGFITNTTGGSIIDRKWDVSPTVQPTSPVNVRYYFTADEYDTLSTALASQSTTVTSPSDIQMFKMTNGGAFADPHGSGATGMILSHGTTPSTAVWKYDAYGELHQAKFLVSSFSGGGGGGGAGGGALPVELIQFSAQAINANTSELKWTTASEINNSHFVIERSYDGVLFEEIGLKQGRGNSNEVINYSHIDATIAIGTKIAYYRLLQYDYDGTSEYSEIRTVDWNSTLLESSLKVYPNPSNGTIYININAEISSQVSVNLMDINGKVLKQWIANEGTSSFSIAGITDGIYFLKYNINGTPHTLKVVKY